MGTRRDNNTEQVSAEHVDDTESESEAEVEDEGSSKRLRKGDDFSHYEQIRDQRIKENKERMRKLGLLDLSLKLKSQPQKENSHYKAKKKHTHDALPPNQSPARRSSRFCSSFSVTHFFILFIDTSFGVSFWWKWKVKGANFFMGFVSSPLKFVTLFPLFRGFRNRVHVTTMKIIKGKGFKLLNMVELLWCLDFGRYGTLVGKAFFF